MPYFPMMINLDDKAVLVIGGGDVGQKKVEILKEFGAQVILVAENAYQRAIELSDVFYNRPFCEEDLLDEKYVMVVAATDDRQLNKHIYELAVKNNIPVNVVDDPELCTFIFPAIIRNGDVVIAVSSGGKSPLVTQYIKSLIKGVLPSRIGKINDRMGEYRSWAKEHISEQPKRHEFLRDKFEETLSDRLDL